MKRQIVILFLCAFSNVFAQDLELSAGKQIKTIKTGTFIEIELPAPGMDTCMIASDNTMAGRFLSYENGVVKLHLYKSTEPILEKDQHLGIILKTYTPGENGPIMTIPKDVILSITIKGKKRLLETHPLDGVAIVLGVLATGTLLSGTYSSDTDQMLLVGGSELGAAIILGILAKQKKYITAEACPAFTKRSKLWKLN